MRIPYSFYLWRLPLVIALLPIVLTSWAIGFMANLVVSAMRGGWQKSDEFAEHLTPGWDPIQK